MPFKSEAQRRYLYAKDPKVAQEFQAHTPKGAKLPEHADNPKLGKLAELGVHLQKLAAQHHKLKQQSKGEAPAEEPAEGDEEAPAHEAAESPQMEASEHDAGEEPVDEDHPLAGLLHKPKKGRTMHMDISRLKKPLPKK